MTAARDKRVAAAFAGYTSHQLRVAGFTMTPASARSRQGLRVRSIARSRCRVVADLDSPREARDLIDAVVEALHRIYVRTERDRDDAVIVYRLGSSHASTDTRQEG